MFHKLRPGLKICWFAVTQTGLQEIQHVLKIFFNISYLCSYPGSFPSRVKFLFFLPLYFLVVCVVLNLLTHYPSRRFYRTVLHQVIQINQWKASAAAVKSKNDEENFEIRIELEETSEIHLLNKESKRTKKK